MSVQRGWPNAGHFYANIVKPGVIFCNFIVDPANGNGLGVRSIKSNGYVRNVFMHTSASPGTGEGLVNPNPAVGYALVQMKNNFNTYLGGFSGFVSPTTGGTSGSTTIHLPFIIASVGTTTLAQWQAAGLPLGLTPTVGQSFIALATGAIGGSGTVIAPGVSGIDSVEVIGDPNTEIANSNIASYGGAWFLVQFLLSGVVTAPNTNSVVGMAFFFDQSNVSVDGL